MFTRLRTFLLFAFVLCIYACSNKEAKQLSLQSFFKSPEKTVFRISPDGKYISYLKASQDKQNIFIQSLVDGKEIAVTSFNDFSVTDYLWNTANQIVYTKDMSSLNQFQIIAVRVDSLVEKNLLTLNNTKARLLSQGDYNSSEIVVGLNDKDSVVYDIYKLNTKSGKLKLLVNSLSNMSEKYIDPQGRVIIGKISDGLKETIYYRKNVNEGLKPLLVNNFKDEVNPIGISINPNIFFALSNLNRDKMALVAIDVRTGKEKVLVTNPKADITSVMYSKQKKIVQMIGWDEDKPKRFFLDSAFSLVYKELSTLIPRREINIIDMDRLEEKLLIHAYADRDPGAYYVYQAKGKRLFKLHDVNADIDPVEMSNVRPIAFLASDSTLLHGYLTVPKGALAKNLPVIVLPHTRLWKSDRWGYNEEVQFLANRGYAVLQVNYRGSRGYGKAFHTAGYKEIGGKIQSDITDGVKWLIQKKIADPKRIGIYGTGIGGFSALYGLCFNSDIYTCAAVQSGVINFFSYFKDTPVYYKPYLNMVYEMIGNPQMQAEKFRAISPVFNADKIEAPLLIFQGAKDPRANVIELNQFVNEIRKKNVKVKYILKENESTIFMSERNRMELYRELEVFLDENLKNKK